MIGTKQQQVSETKSWAGMNEMSLTTVRELRLDAPSPRKAKRVVKNPYRPSPVPSLVYTTSPHRLQRVPEDVMQPKTQQKASEAEEIKKKSTCPIAREFQQARDHHPVLASTGCTKDFCQAGRAAHTDEPRIGENRALEVIEQEAEGFLRELHREQFFASDEAFAHRLNGVLAEIKAGVSDGDIREGKQHGKIGGNWQQTPAELEFGLRRAWRNARKCIMRSHCEELKLCDLRHVTSSAQMASDLVRYMCEAFNGGNVLPTVLVFPPRKVNSRGPMIWNHQLLEFAGYETEDGSILGDPMSAALTKAIIGLGWKPPNPKSRWDVLPLVVIADNDVPVMIEIPAILRELIKIRHPRFNDEFEKLDLRWVAFPALTRLGFDIGGVQYTAAPFAGWFMDAEIGVRDLADTFRYNALPDVAKALGLLDGKIEDGAEGLEDLPEYERLSILTRAQTELTYAAYWSYQQAKVSMSDTLTASMKWCRYDDEFKAKNGFRLPADPYWLAPPQGSIIPVWHRGGAPNYQPKPMICRHVQDPLKAWEREKQDWFVAAKPLNFVANIHPKRPSLQGRRITSDSITRTWETRHMREARKFVGERRSMKQRHELQRETLSTDEPGSGDLPKAETLSVSIHFCSAGTLAEKIATKLHFRLSDLAKSISSISVCSRIEVLNNFRASAMSPSNLSLIVVSSTGQGEVPANGNQFVTMCNGLAGDQLANPSTRFRYAILGNGDSRYAATYNGAAVIVERSLRKIGGLAMAGGLYHGDTAVHATALQALGPWWVKLQPSIHDLATDSPKLRRVRSGEAIGQGQTFEPANTQAEAKQRLGVRVKQLLSEFQTASVVNVSPSPREGYQGTYLTTLDNKKIPYEDMGCVQLLPINSPAKVRTALRALGVNGSTKISLQLPDMEDPSYSTFLTEYIDLELPFQNIEWLKSRDSTTNTAVSEEKLRSLSSLDSLSYLNTLGILPAEPTLTESICLALPLLHPRTYSTASSLSYQSASLPKTPHSKPPPPSQTHLDLLVKPLPNGRFSHTFLSHPTPSPLRYRLLPSPAASLLSLPPTTPLLILATGAGFAPVRCLLQRHIAAPHTSPAAISLFLGLKAADVPLFADILNEAAAAGVLERLCVVGSNEERVRVYDRLREEGIRERVRAIVGEGGWVFVCMSPEAARGTRGVFEEVVWEGGVKGMGERWVEEVF